jgi:hypothetical protein
MPTINNPPATPHTMLRPRHFSAKWWKKPTVTLSYWIVH